MLVMSIVWISVVPLTDLQTYLTLNLSTYRCIETDQSKLKNSFTEKLLTVDKNVLPSLSFENALIQTPPVCFSLI